MKITHLFLDIGGVLLTNGWDHQQRRLAAKYFKIDFDEMEGRHHLIFESLEIGKFTLDEYLDQVVFYKKRPFTKTQFIKFMQDQSKQLPYMIEFVQELKKRHGFKITVISNENRALNDYRIRKFKLDQFVDSFISSCYVGLRKPDKDIFRLAIDTSHANLASTIYIENTPMFVEIAESLGIRSILHKDYNDTRKQLNALGIK